MKRCVRSLPVIVMTGLGVTGCAPNNADMLHFLREHRHKVSAIEYRIGIPDAIAIQAPRIVEIDGDTQQVRPDGKIGLRLLGDVKVVGMTAKEIAAKLEVLLSKYYIDPKVSVRVAAFLSKKYYVHGFTAAAGSRPYTGRDTVLDVVLRGYGPGTNLFAWTSRVKVIRPSHGETPVRTITVNVDKMLQKGDWSQNILLEPNDIVYIPPTPAAWLGLRVREALFPLVPVIEAYTAPAYLRGLDDVYEEDSDYSWSARGPNYGGRRYGW